MWVVSPMLMGWPGHACNTSYIICLFWTNTFVKQIKVHDSVLRVPLCPLNRFPCNLSCVCICTLQVFIWFLHNVVGATRYIMLCYIWGLLPSSEEKQTFWNQNFIFCDWLEEWEVNEGRRGVRGIHYDIFSVRSLSPDVNLPCSGSLPDMEQGTLASVTWRTWGTSFLGSGIRWWMPGRRGWGHGGGGYDQSYWLGSRVWY